MLYVSALFLFSFALVWALSWLVPANRGRKLLLLFASYGFYAAWDVRFLALIVGSTVLDFVAGYNIDRSDNKASKKRWLAISLAGNLGALGFFKYYGFFLDSMTLLLAPFEVDVAAFRLDIILPVGISFYTFQSLSYTVDVYRGQLKPTEDLADFALFVAFFPQLVAGPIVRAREFLPQLRARPRFSAIAHKTAIVLFALGAFKKVVLADGIGRWVDVFYAEPAHFDAGSAWLSSFLFGAELYCDFSAYTDMALGCAALLGYRLCQNFDRPFLATNPADYWRRWHISLTTWFFDYVYTPMATRLGTQEGAAVAIVLTFALAGLWHGAAGTFVLWGLAHGVGVLVFLVWQERGRPALGGRTLPTWIAFLLMHTWSAGLAPLFRAQDLSQAALVLGGLFGGSQPDQHLPWPLWALVGGLLLVHWATHRFRVLTRVESWPWPLVAVVVGILVQATIWFYASEGRPHVYFQF